MRSRTNDLLERLIRVTPLYHGQLARFAPSLPSAGSEAVAGINEAGGADQTPRNGAYRER
jgi:hypothetical protein